MGQGWFCFRFWFAYRFVLACLAHLTLATAINVNCAYFVLWKAYDILWFWSHLVLCACIPALRPENYLVVWCNLIYQKCTKYPRRTYKQIYNLLYNFKGTKAEQQLQRLRTIEIKERQRALESQSSSSSSEESAAEVNYSNEPDQSKFNVFVDEEDINRLSQDSTGANSVQMYPDLPEEAMEGREIPTITVNGVMEEGTSKEDSKLKNGKIKSGEKKALSFANLKDIPFKFRFKRSISAELKVANKDEVLTPTYSNPRDLSDQKAIAKREHREKKALEKKLRKRRKAELEEMARMERKRKTTANAVELLLQCLRMITSFAILIGNIRKTFIPAQFQYLPPGRHAYDNNDVLLFFRITVFLDVSMFWINTMRTMCMQWHLCYRLGICKFWLWASILGVLGGIGMIFPMHYVYEELDVSWCHFKANSTLAKYKPNW